jgi:aldose 1-epimerase
MTPERVGATADGTLIHRWTLERARTRVRLLTYGGIVQSVEVPGRDGSRADVVLGFREPRDYLSSHGPYFGALIGRYANRVGGAAFTLDGHTYQLPRNDGPNCLHGGERGFDRRVWDAEPAGDSAVRLSRVSPDGEEGFPGRLAVSVTYTLEADGALRLDYRAETGAPTPVSLTNHTYWNLGGASGTAGSGTAAGHLLRLAAGRITLLDGDSVPTGELASVDGTRFDFREARRVGIGYDHNYVLDERRTAGRRAVRPGVGAGPDRRDDGARYAALHGRPLRREAVRAGRRDRAGDAGVPRLTEPAGFPRHGAAARRGVRVDDDVRVRRAVDRVRQAVGPTGAGPGHAACMPPSTGRTAPVT